MPVTIQHKRNATANAVPGGVSLAAGELAVNTADGRVYTKLNGGTVVDVAAVKDASVSVAKLTTGARGIGYAATILFG